MCTTWNTSYWRGVSVEAVADSDGQQTSDEDGVNGQHQQDLYRQLASRLPPPIVKGDDNCEVGDGPSIVEEVCSRATHAPLLQPPPLISSPPHLLTRPFSVAYVLTRPIFSESKLTLHDIAHNEYVNFHPPRHPLGTGWPPHWPPRRRAVLGVLPHLEPHPHRPRRGQG